MHDQSSEFDTAAPTRSRPRSKWALLVAVTLAFASGYATCGQRVDGVDLDAIAAAHAQTRDCPLLQGRYVLPGRIVSDRGDRPVRGADPWQMLDDLWLDRGPQAGQASAQGQIEVQADADGLWLSHLPTAAEPARERLRLDAPPTQALQGRNGPAEYAVGCVDGRLFLSRVLLWTQMGEVEHYDHVIVALRIEGGDLVMSQWQRRISKGGLLFTTTRRHQGERRLRFAAAGAL